MNKDLGYPCPFPHKLPRSTEVLEGKEDIKWERRGKL